MSNDFQAIAHRAMAASAQCFSREYAGSADTIALVRKQLKCFLADFSRIDDVVLVCSELATNAIRHTKSGEPDGYFAVYAIHRPGHYTYLEVMDQGGPWADDPRCFPAGHGLSIVNQLADGWEIRGGDNSRTICAIVRIQQSDRQPAAILSP